MASEDTKKTFISQGAEVDYMGPAEFGKFVPVETAKWDAVVKKTGVRTN